MPWGLGSGPTVQSYLPFSIRRRRKTSLIGSNRIHTQQRCSMFYWKANFGQKSCMSGDHTKTCLLAAMLFMGGAWDATTHCALASGQMEQWEGFASHDHFMTRATKHRRKQHQTSRLLLMALGRWVLKYRSFLFIYFFLLRRECAS